MARKKLKKKLKLKLVPRLGAATNLRPAGAHASMKLYNRKRAKAAFRKDDEGGPKHFETDYNVE